jgi:phosphotransferase system HPr (HPr) family protein
MEWRNSMLRKLVRIGNESGLTTRDANEISKICKCSDSIVRIRKHSNPELYADGRNVLEILMLALSSNDMAEVVVDGEDELRLMIRLEEIIESAVPSLCLKGALSF